MSNLILFDSDVRDHLLPLTYSRPVGDLRVGILTIREKWERHLRLPGSFLANDSLRGLFPVEYGAVNLLVDGSVLPTAQLCEKVLGLTPGQAYRKDGQLIAACLDSPSFEQLLHHDAFPGVETLELTDLEPVSIRRPADIFMRNADELRADFELLTQGRTSCTPSATNTIIGPPENLFVAEGVQMEACVISVVDGPVYIGANAILLEGSLLRSPLGVGAGALVKMGAKIYGGTTVGPHCKVGGEIKNVVLHSNSNKGHEGYLGDAVIGSWCNIGADTNASNLKNDYGEVRVWDYVSERFEPSGLQFHGLVMGDHSKIGINTMLNTGTVIGFSTNLYGEGFPRAFIPSFSWGGPGGYQTYRLDKALATARRVASRRHHEIGEAEEKLFEHIFNVSQSYRPK